ncbi:hypothetical protein BLNAU_11476 [Blattamonas nauphoetae]|uniref:Uncharacterized protein n=1 Tax=Blattamonas nauphoetae TaxID=2049346 RepID=A0ABQ9XQE3_9EUKA|nr:hypothetical protein BLNAU_11476 [Blattamonas nauphoetae]
MEAARSDMERRNIEGLTFWMDCVYGWTVTGDVGVADGEPGELGDVARKFLWKEEEVSSSEDDDKKGGMLLTKEEKRERREKIELRRKMKESEELVRRQRRDEDSLFPRWLVGEAYLGAALVDEGKEESRPMLGEERVRRKKGKVDEMLIENKFSILTQSSKIAGPPTNEAELVEQRMEGLEEGSVQRMKERIEESSSFDNRITEKSTDESRPSNSPKKSLFHLVQTSSFFFLSSRELAHVECDGSTDQVGELFLSISVQPSQRANAFGTLDAVSHSKCSPASFAFSSAVSPALTCLHSRSDVIPLSVW